MIQMSQILRQKEGEREVTRNIEYYIRYDNQCWLQSLESKTNRYNKIIDVCIYKNTDIKVVVSIIKQGLSKFSMFDICI